MVISDRAGAINKFSRPLRPYFLFNEDQIRSHLDAEQAKGKRCKLLFPILFLVFMLDSHGATCQRFNPLEWKFESQREELMPVSYIDSDLIFNGKPTLAIKGGGKSYADGHWYKRVAVDPGKYFQFRACFSDSEVEEPNRSILARILWQNEKGQQVGFAEYPALLGGKTPAGWTIIEQTYKAPPEAKQAKMELHYRWDANGVVHFGDVTFEKDNPPVQRIVRLATIYYRPRNSQSSLDNIKKFSALVEQAAAEKADIICLPEESTLVGTELDYVSASEPVPGPTTELLGQVARKYHLYIVAGLLEKDGDVVYNTSVLINRNGELAGKYRKISLPREEIDGGITPGDSLPVFKTDFGRIGMMICWDVSFPETARTLARQGAEIIFLPIWGGDLTLTKARAIENQVYIVSSSYDMISAVFDQEGEVIKQATNDHPVVVAEVDLNKQRLLPWLGDFKNRIPTEMPPQKAIRNKSD